MKKKQTIASLKNRETQTNKLLFTEESLHQKYTHQHIYFI